MVLFLLKQGSRLCAYWSQQYRCLYPGTVAVSSSPDYEQNSKYVVVEFDDGDSGRIAIEDIRFLTCDYPVVGKKCQKYTIFLRFDSLQLHQKLSKLVKYNL